jgi:hypothetical protein
MIMLQQGSTDVVQLWHWGSVSLTFISSMMATFAGKSSIAQWLTNRIPDQISIINQELERTDGLNPAMRTLLEQTKEALLFRMTKGIAVSGLMAREMIAVSENYPGGIKWSRLKRASSYLTLDERGKLTVKISKGAWAGGGITATGAVGCLWLVLYIGILLKDTASASALAVGFALIVVAGAGMMFCLHLPAKILAARRVARHLKSRPDGRTAPGEIKEGAAKTETLTAGERSAEIAGDGGRAGRQIAGAGVKKAVGGSVGDIDMDASHDRIVDLAVYSADRKLQLIVEVNSKRDADSEWAADLRSSIFDAEARLTDVPYFLLATPDRFFLWKRQTPTWSPDGSPAPPDYTADARPFMAAHLVYDRQDASEVWHKEITKDDLSMALLSWFDRLCYSPSAIEDLSDRATWVFESGLFDVIRGGTVEFEPPV